jgi:hypothetical protein
MRKPILVTICIVIPTAVLSPASAATKHHRAAQFPASYEGTGGGCTASGGPACSSACTGSGPCAPPDRW